MSEGEGREASERGVQLNTERERETQEEAMMDWQSSKMERWGQWWWMKPHPPVQTRHVDVAVFGFLFVYWKYRILQQLCVHNFVLFFYLLLTTSDHLPPSPVILCLLIFVSARGVIRLSFWAPIFVHLHLCPISPLSALSTCSQHLSEASSLCPLCSTFASRDWLMSWPGQPMA